MDTVPAPSRLATLHPAWGAALMTISGVALVSLRDPFPASPVDDVAGLILLALAAVFALALTAASVARMIRHRAAFLADLTNPGIGAMIASWPAGLQVFALAVLQAGTAGVLDPGVALTAGMIAFVPGVLGTIVAGLAFFSRVIGQPDVPPAAVSGAWFVPVVPLVLVPSILIRAVALGLPGEATLWTFLAIVAWGTGFALFLLLAPIIGSRLLVAAPPAPHQAPSWWGWLAPLGAGGLGLYASARFADETGALPGLVPAAGLVITVLWGFSVWWLIFAIGVLVRERRDLHFHTGWWGFGFPSAASLSLTGEVAKVWQFAWLQAVIPVLWIALVAVFVGLVVGTIRSAAKGTVWQR